MAKVFTSHQVGLAEIGITIRNE